MATVTADDLLPVGAYATRIMTFNCRTFASRDLAALVSEILRRYVAAFVTVFFTVRTDPPEARTIPLPGTFTLISKEEPVTNFFAVTFGFSTGDGVDEVVEKLPGPLKITDPAIARTGCVDRAGWQASPLHGAAGGGA